MELHHAFLTDRIHARENRLRAGDGFVADVRDKILGGLPRLAALVSRTMTCRRMPKLTCRPRCAASAATGAIFSATCAGGSPQVKYLSIVSAATSTAASDEPPK